jgi:hypothetical protein
MLQKYDQAMFIWTLSHVFNCRDLETQRNLTFYQLLDGWIYCSSVTIAVLRNGLTWFVCVERLS